jgi:hypothetical protein
MKKHILLFTLLIFTGLTLSAQKTKDVLYLKNGSIINGKLLEIKEDRYKIQTYDGSIFIYNSEEVDKLEKETPLFKGRKSDGFGLALEAGVLAGAQTTDYSAPFSFNILACYTAKIKNEIGIGSGVEFIGKPYTPLFLEYKYLINNRETTPFLFIRGGGLFPLSGSDSGTPTEYNTPFNYKGGGSFAIGTGISWSKNDYESYCSFAYRYAHTSYQQKEYNSGITTYESSVNRLEIKFGFRF